MALEELVMSMVGTYSSVDVGEEGRISQRLEDIVIRIALQTIECSIFILHYISAAGR